MAALNENPLVAILEIRARRHPIKVNPWLVLILLVVIPLILGGVVALAAIHEHAFGAAVKDCLALSVGSLGVIVAILSIFMFLAQPLVQLSSNTSTLLSLRRGGGLEELLGTGFSAAELLDGLATYNVLAWMRSLNRFHALLAALLTPYLLWGGVSPLHIVAVVGAWALVIPVIVYCTTYPVALNSLWDEELGRSTIYQLVRVGVVGVILLPSALILFSLLSALAFSLSWGNLATWGFYEFFVLAFYLPLTRWAARRLALLGMEKLPTLLAKVNSVQSGFLRRRRNGWIRPFTTNPIEFRESVREAVTTPFGLVGLMVVRLPALTLSLILVTMRPDSWPAVLLLAILSSFIMSTHKTLNTFLGDIERKTWEPLCQSGLTARELIDGLLWVGFRFRLVESLGILAVVGLQAHALGVDWWAAWVMTLLVPMVGCTIGLAGALAGSRVQAHQRCSNLTILLVMVWLFWTYVTSSLYLHPAIATPAFLLLTAISLRNWVLCKVSG